MLLKFLGIVFVLALVFGVPALSLATARRAEVRLLPRLSLYFSAALSQWILTALGLLVVFLTDRSLFERSFHAIGFHPLVVWVSILVTGSLASLGVILFLERRGWWPRESDLVYLLIPETRREKIWAVLIISTTAALCEEFLYRGYLLGQLSQWLHSSTLGWGASSMAFGMAHAYQGWNGMLRAALLGGFLGYPVVRLGSLYPSIAAHFMIDALALVWLGPRFLPSDAR
jgi:membrane protease YdiL (CAAX protease family)